jgi:hypothetical protein
MSLVLQSSGGGSVTIAEPTTASNFTQNLPAADGAVMISPQALTIPNVTGTVMVSGNMPAFSAGANAATSLSGGTFTKVLFADEEFDTNNNYASSTFTPTVAGYYQINGAVSVATGAQLAASIYKNGSEFKRGSNIRLSSDGSVVSSIIYFNGSTDYVEIYCFATTTINTNNATNTVWFNGAMVRAA